MPSAKKRETRVLRVDPQQIDAAIIDEAGAMIARGSLVAFPTETVYGLGAHALDEAAVHELFAAKGRPASDPVIVHLVSREDVGSIAQDVPPVLESLATRFWPGPLTVILRKKPHVPAAITAGLATVGVRVPRHPVAAALLRAAAVPVAAPSANRFSRPSPTCAEHVLDDLAGAIDLVLDAGPSEIGVESTVLDLTVSPPLVRRPGGVSIEDLRTVVPDLQTSTQSGRDDRPQVAPGQLVKHYAPRAPLTLFVGERSATSERVAARARALAGSGQRVGILGPEEDLMAMAPTLVALATAGRIRFANYGSRRDPWRAARELFAALRSLDAEGVNEILAVAPEVDGVGLAIVDRLTRAAEGRVQRV